MVRWQVIEMMSTMMSILSLIYSCWKGRRFVKLTTSNDDAVRLGNKDNGLQEIRLKKTSFDLKIFNPLTKVFTEISSSVFYNESVREEHI